MEGKEGEGIEREGKKGREERGREGEMGRGGRKRERGGGGGRGRQERERREREGGKREVKTVIILSYTPTEEAKRFEDGLQEQKDFLSIQRKYVRLLCDLKHVYIYIYMCVHVLLPIPLATLCTCSTLQRRYCRLKFDLVET